MTKYKDLVEQLSELNEQIKDNPILFYGEIGREAIILSKEIHLLGAELIRKAKQKQIEMTLTYPFNFK